MKNYEKYAEVIKAYANGTSYCDEIIMPNVLKPLGKSCSSTNCVVCNALTTLWLMEEYEEPEVDWTKVAVDTPILVKDFEHDAWCRRYFAKFEKGRVYAWTDGATEWSVEHSDSFCGWNYAKLAEQEKIDGK